MKFSFLLLALFLVNGLFADSPLTSTYFAKVCGADEVLKDFKANGFNEKLMAFLSNKNESAVHKIALINEMSWGNKTYVAQYESYLLEQHPSISQGLFEELKSNQGSFDEYRKKTKSLSADELMAWAYLQSMGDYFNPQFANKAATIAYQRTKEKSMAHSAVYTLIRCQMAFDISWCEVYKIGNTQFREKGYKKNQLSEEAVKIILEYLDLYKGDC